MHDNSMPDFDDAMRLAIAFYCIMEPERREIVMALAEKYALESRRRASRDELVALIGHALASELETSTASLEVRMLSRQRAYAATLHGLQFAILEDAIQRMSGLPD